MILRASLLFVIFTSSIFAQEDGLEVLREKLEKNAKENIEKAQLVWEQNKKTFFEEGDRRLLKTFQEHAPYIQDPLFKELESLLLNKETNNEKISRVLQALTISLEESGAMRLLNYFDDIPKNEKAYTLWSIIQRGDKQIHTKCLPYTTSANTPLRQAAIEGLLVYGNKDHISVASQHIDYEKFNLDQLGAALAEMGSRIEASHFNFNPIALDIKHDSFIEGLLIFLTKNPVKESGNYLITIALNLDNSNVNLESQEQALKAFEAGSIQFKWSKEQNKLQRFLKSNPKSSIAKEIAWTLHRLGDSKGTQFLLETPQKSYKDSKGEWKYAVSLAKLQVELNLHKEAYSVFTRSYKAIRNPQNRNRIRGEDCIWAARAAAGARRPTEALEWLDRSGYSTKELRQYKSMPEFKSYLDRIGFEALFGTEN
jgi:hypothetical protein